MYAQACAAHIDPIKKPLFHYSFNPGIFNRCSRVQIECKFCQNWSIAQYPPEQVSFPLPPLELVSLAKGKEYDHCLYITEPVVYYEYMYDTEKHARSMGVGSVMISNGYIRDP